MAGLGQAWHWPGPRCPTAGHWCRRCGAPQERPSVRGWLCAVCVLCVRACVCCVCAVCARFCWDGVAWLWARVLRPCSDGQTAGLLSTHTAHTHRGWTREGPGTTSTMAGSTTTQAQGHSAAVPHSAAGTHCHWALAGLLTTCRTRSPLCLLDSTRPRAYCSLVIGWADECATRGLAGRWSDMDRMADKLDRMS